MSMNFLRKLPIPMEIKDEYPITKKMEDVKEVRDAEIKKVFRGESDKFLLIIGPCSADEKDSVMDYIERLKRVEEKVSDKIIIIPRIYTNKPRTNGSGYKGMLHQPHRDKRCAPYSAPRLRPLVGGRNALSRKLQIPFGSFVLRCGRRKVG